MSVTVQQESEARAPGVMPGLSRFGNRVLDRLPADAALRAWRRLEQVRFEAGALVQDDGARDAYLYFPQDCAISLQCSTREGTSVEFAMIGSEGVLGVDALILDDAHMRGRAIAIRRGSALRIPARELFGPARTSSRFRAAIESFQAALYGQIVQRSICHRMHSIEQQLSTWLLLMADRTCGAAIEVTHELLGDLLGGRREGVTLALRRLRDADCLRSGYRQIVIADRSRLESRACECYAAVQKEYRYLVPVCA